MREENGGNRRVVSKRVAWIRKMGKGSQKRNKISRKKEKQIKSRGGGVLGHEGKGGGKGCKGLDLE